MFKKKYKLYFHKVNDSNWGIDSYIYVCDIDNEDDLLYLYKKIPNYTSGMFFLMNHDVKPIYEDKKNINGGVCTFKLPKKECNKFWKNICYLYCNNKLTKKEEDSNIITGLSISPKINNCILKIWISKSVKVNILKSNIKFLDLRNAMYRNHLNNM